MARHPDQWTAVAVSHKDTAHNQDRFYEVDLPALVEANDAEAFLYFYAFFRRSAFEPGPVSLDALLKERAAYARSVGESLKSQVYDGMKELAQGFLDEPGNAIDLHRLRDALEHSLSRRLKPARGDTANMLEQAAAHAGDGLTFVHAGGMIEAFDLKAGETLRVDTGCLVALTPTVQYDVQFVGKVKTALFGGEGLFFAVVTGPGRVWLQSLPLSRMADRIIKAAPGLARGGKEEGSILGGIGNLLDGDN